MFSYIFLRFHTFQILGTNSNDFRIVENRKKSQTNVRNRTKLYEISPNSNGFLQFCTVLYDFRRLFFFIRDSVKKVYINTLPPTENISK